MIMADSLLCIRCENVSTTNRNKEGQPLCAACSNHLYLEDKMNGKIIELKIDMNRVKTSTYYQIQALIAKDMEDSK